MPKRIKKQLTRKYSKIRKGNPPPTIQDEPLPQYDAPMPGYGGNRKRGAAIGARMAKRYPYANYGRQYIPKGHFLSQAGASYKQANAEQRAWRRANNYSGVGGFWGDMWGGIKRLGKAHGAKALGALGGRFLGPLGAEAGSAVGHALGMGAYRMGGVGSYGDISTNDIVHGGSGDSMAIAKVNPSMSDDSGDVILSHSEYMGNVVASATILTAGTTVQSQFQNNVYPINPGLQGTFPFLSQLAQNYTMYRLEGVIFQYKPTSGEGAGGSNALGKIIMATDYDPMALPFINSVQMENYQYSQSTKPSLAARHGVECAPSQGSTDMKYIRTGTSNRDKAFTDLGLFQIATEGIPITGPQGPVLANIGELWVSYKVRLSRANLYSSLLGYGIRADYYDVNTAATGAQSEAPVPYTVSKDYSQINNIGTTIQFRQAASNLSVCGDSLTITWPSSQILGVYRITIFSNFSTADTALQYTAWAPLQPGNYTTVTSTGVDRTQWGCTFLPVRTNSGQGPIKPNVDTITGLPVWAINTAAGSVLHIITSSEPTSTPLSQTTTVTYFAINSPSTTVPKLVMQLITLTSGNAYSSNRNAMLPGAADHRVLIEQVNAEISN